MRLEGKIDLLVQKMDSQATETLRLRDSHHRLANDVAPLVLLGIPEKLVGHEARIAALESDRDQRKGAMMVMRAIWALIGFLGAGALLGIIKMLGAV